MMQAPGFILQADAFARLKHALNVRPERTVDFFQL